MTKVAKTLRSCTNGHQYYKSSDCPICPVCAEEQKANEGFLSLLSAPARRALENNGITTAEQLSEFSESHILKFHGLGPGSIPKLKTALENHGLSFKK